MADVIQNCPNCGHSAGTTWVFKCNDCGKIFCRDCPMEGKRAETQNNDSCPRCGSTSRTTLR